VNSLPSKNDLESFLKATLQKNVTIQRKPQNQTIWHWLLLLIFACLVFGSPMQQIVLIGLFTIISAVVKGPLTMLWGVIYSALITIFPPIGLILALVFFLLNLGTVMKSWRISLTSAYFYLVPIAITILKQGGYITGAYALPILTAISVVGLHFLLEWLYRNDSLSRILIWRVINVPYSLLLLLIPNRFLVNRRMAKSKRK
jgi:uncharacterized phage infection (PIP) family protein YhgE